MSFGEAYRPVLPNVLFVLACVATFLWGGCKEEIGRTITGEPEVDTVFIIDVTVKDAHFPEIIFERPTIVIFSNLKTATNSIYFHQCVNIKEVRFPELVSVGDSDALNPYLHFYQNRGLERVQAPKLTTVYGYVYFYGNSSLDLSTGICGISDIYPRGDPDAANCADGYVDIVANGNNSPCFSAAVHLCN